MQSSCKLDREKKNEINILSSRRRLFVRAGKRGVMLGLG